MTPRGRAVLGTIAWGVFCACSWTWCIGMFLPKVLVERYGLAGFVVFALPNVIGCAGFGYVLGTADRSRALVERHRPAMVTFSIVAVAFHLLFAAVLVTLLVPPGRAAVWPLVAAPFALLIGGLVISVMSDRGWLGAAAITYVISLLAFSRLDAGGLAYLDDNIAHDLGGLAWLTPIIVIGFLLCPLLDLTFHRALQRSPSRHAFAVFGATFTVMIVLTPIIWFAWKPLVPIVLAHLVVQSLFTVGAHLREIRTSPAILGAQDRAFAVLTPLVVVPLIPIALALSASPDVATDMYVRFFVFYGLVFPAYVLAFIGPWRPAGLTKRAALSLGAIVLVLAPFYELGFLHGRPALLAAPVLVLITWAGVRRRGEV